MASSSQFLPTLMSVLDHADETEALTRERLLASAKAVGTGHSDAVLEASVDWQLAQVVPAVAPPEKPYVFTWKRPRNSAEQNHRLQRWKWLAWWEKAVPRRLVTLTVLSAFVWILAPFLYAVCPNPAGDRTSEELWSVSIMMATLFGLPFTLVVWLILEGLFTAGCKDPRLLVGNLKHPAKDYLEYAGPRAYLRAVMSSDLPDLLERDGDHLDWLYTRDLNAQYRDTMRRQEARHAAALAASQAQERATRMTQFAKGLQQGP